MVDGFIPKDLEEALKVRAEKGYVPYAGGTDLCVVGRKGAGYLFIGKLPELKTVRDDGEYIRIGAAVTFAEALKCDLIPGIMKDAVSGIGAPAIRNAGTFGGNLGNGSGKADTVSVEVAMDAKIVLKSVSGERIIPVDGFCLGNKQTLLKDDEIITEILLPRTGTDRYYYEKVGGRKSLALSRISFAGIFAEEDGKITNAAAAFGAVDDTVLRFRDIEGLILGKTKEEARLMKEEYIGKYTERFDFPIDRVSADYRKRVCANLLNEFLDTFL